VPYLKTAVVHDDESGHVTLFALNRHLTESLSLKALLRGFEGLRIVEARQLRHDDLMAANTKDSPDEIKPVPLDAVRVDGNGLAVDLAPASWSVIRLSVQGG
jgi:alpha-N-arabinofuranosidase